MSEVLIRGMDSARPFTSSFVASPHATSSLAAATNTLCFGGVCLTVADGVSMVRASCRCRVGFVFSTVTPSPYRRSARALTTPGGVSWIRIANLAFPRPRTSAI